MGTACHYWQGLLVGHVQGYGHGLPLLAWPTYRAMGTACHYWHGLLVSHVQGYGHCLPLLAGPASEPRAGLWALPAIIGMAC